VPPQNPVDRTIVDVSALGVKLAYPDASLAVPPASDRRCLPARLLAHWHNVVEGLDNAGFRSSARLPKITQQPPAAGLP
jgi:hypothetical protein